MTALGGLVLVGAAILVVAVWLIPIDRSTAAETTPETDERAAPGASVAATPVVDGVQRPTVVAAPERDLTPDPIQAAAPLGVMTPTSTSVPVSCSPQLETLGSSSGLSATGSTTATGSPSPPGTDGAASRLAYPVAIPIPVVMSVATRLDPAPAPPLATADPVPVRRDAPFENSSAPASSVTWSPRPRSDDGPDLMPRFWHGSSSIVARVSGVELPALESPVRRGLLLAAGAGLAVAIAVAVRR